MDTTLFKQFTPVIRSLSNSELNGSISLNSKLILAREDNMEVCYIPFEHLNKQARVVIVGITPGRTQMLNALKEAQKQLDAGASNEDCLMASKKIGAFSGAMRQNLIALLDSIGLNKWLKITSCDELFGTSSHLVQTTSALCNPVFVNGENYNGTPSMTKSPFLKNQLLTYFGKDVQALPNAVFIPLGDKVAEALHFLANEGMLSRDSIIDGLPHPSGANAERIAYFLGNKDRENLSPKTNPDKLDQARTKIIEHVLALA